MREGVFTVDCTRIRTHLAVWKSYTTLKCSNTRFLFFVFHSSSTSLAGLKEIFLRQADQAGDKDGRDISEAKEQ